MQIDFVAPNPDDYVILPGVYGKDPMGPVVRQDDPQWRDIVAWTVYVMIKQVGNYGEVFKRNVGKASPLKLERGINALWTKGGLIYYPPFK
jgi:general L-amino acid transport system substrate-binding protein